MYNEKHNQVRISRSCLGMNLGPEKQLDLRSQEEGGH